MDDDGLRQIRSRRRFQTGLLIFLLLFLMDSKGPQVDSQGRSRSTAQVGLAERVLYYCTVVVRLNGTSRTKTRGASVPVRTARARDDMIRAHLCLAAVRRTVFVSQLATLLVWVGGGGGNAYLVLPLL